MWKKLRDKATRGAMKVMSSERAQKVLDSDEFQEAVLRAVITGMRVKRDLSDARRAIASQLEVSPDDDLSSLKEELDERVQRLQEEGEGAQPDT